MARPDVYYHFINFNHRIMWKTVKLYKRMPIRSLHIILHSHVCYTEFVPGKEGQK